MEKVFKMPVASISSPYSGFQRRPETEAQRRQDEGRDEFSDYVFSRQTLTTTDEEAWKQLSALKLPAQLGVFQQEDRRSANRNAVWPTIAAEKQKAYDHSGWDEMVDIQQSRAMDVSS